MKHWNGYPRKVGDAPSLQALEVRLDSEKPDLVENASAYCRDIRTDDL